MPYQSYSVNLSFSFSALLAHLELNWTHKVPRSIYTLPLWSHHEVGHCYRCSVVMKKPPLCVESHEEATWSPHHAGGLFSSSAAASFHRPETENSGRTRLHFLGQRSEVVWGEGGDGCTGRHSQEVACPFYSNLCKCCALLFTPDLWLLCSGNVTAVINCQTSTILVLEALPNKTD